MSEMLFVEAVRRHIDSLPEEQTGWLAGMPRCRGGARALAHPRKPSEVWTLERLSEEWVFRARPFHERFSSDDRSATDAVSDPVDDAGGIGAAPRDECEAARGGGERRLRSEAAFSRAFKRVAGRSPERGKAKNLRSLNAPAALRFPRRTWCNLAWLHFEASRIGDAWAASSRPTEHSCHLQGDSGCRHFMPVVHFSWASLSSPSWLSARSRDS